MPTSGAARIDRLLRWALPILAMVPAYAQEVRVSSRPYAPSPFVLRVETDLVETVVVVRDHNGRAIAGLTRDDFKILDEGKDRQITAFSIETSASAGKTVPMESGVSASPAKAEHPAPVTRAEPRYVALLFDDVHTRHGDLTHARVAAEQFVQEALQPGDRVAIYTTSGVRALAFTADVGKLRGAIEKLSAHPRISEDGEAPCPRITPYQAYLIVSLDMTALQAALDEAHSCAQSASPGMGGRLTTALVQADVTDQAVRIQAEQTWDHVKTISQGTLDSIRGVVDDLAKMPGGRVLLLASSGFLAETLEFDQSRIIDRALAANVVINALDAKGLFSETSVRRPDQLHYLTTMPLTTQVFESTSQLPALETANTPLINFAQSTGGQFFHNSNDLTLGFRQLAAVPEVTYRLGFRPGESKARYHKLQVKLTKANSYLVQGRRGYFAPGKGADQAASPRQQLDREVSAADAVSDIPASVKVEPGKSKSGKPLVWVSVHVDLKALPFTERAGHHLEGIVFVTALCDAKGNVVTAKEGRMDLELTEATFARLTQTGVNARLSLEAPPGAYRLREVVQEAVAGKMSASNQDIRID